MKGRALVILAVGLSLGADAPENAKGEREKLQGTWVVESLENDGKQEAVAADKKMTMVFTGDKYTFKGGDVNYQGTFKLDPTKDPKHMDTTGTQEGDKAFKTEGIYKLEGDRLTICWTEDAGKRPASFATKKDSGLRLIQLKRQK